MQSFNFNNGKYEITFIFPLLKLIDWLIDFPDTDRISVNLVSDWLAQIPVYQNAD